MVGGLLSGYKTGFGKFSATWFTLNLRISDARSAANMGMKTALDRDYRLRWLIGETIVIVLGVLIALALDEIWTDRQERALEADYLSRIRIDVANDIQYITDIRSERMKQKFAALKAIAPVVRGHEPVPVDVEAFLTSVSLAGLLGASNSKWVTDTTFEDLKSTGNLRLIKSTDLRREISNYYNFQERQHQRVRDRQTEYVSTVHSIIPAELRTNLNAESLSEFGTERAIERILSPEFQDRMNQEFNYAYFLQSVIESTAAIHLLQEIDAYVAQR